MITGANVVSLVTLLAHVAKDEPEILHAIEDVFSSKRRGVPLTPALKHLEVLAAEKFLGIGGP